MNFIPARCPSCGGELMIPDDMKKIICSHCGTTFFLEQTQTPTPTIENWLKLAETALIGNNASEALKYYNKVLEIDTQNWIAWLGKGKSVVQESTIAKFLFDEMFLSFQQALQYSPNEKRQEILNDVIEYSGKVLNAFSRAVGLHYAEYCRDISSVLELIQHYEKICQKIDMVYQLDEENFENFSAISLGIDISTELLNGYEYADMSGNFKKYKLTQPIRDNWKAKYDKYLNIMKALDSSFEPYTKLL
jgi:tetratricopeptide (TPR) repeat protein